MPLSWFIAAKFIHIMHIFYLREKGLRLLLRLLEAAVFWYRIISIDFFAIKLLLTSILLFVLVWNENIAEKPFVYFFQQSLSLQISKRSSVQILKILTVWTLKKTLNQVSHLKMNASNYAATFLIKSKIVHIRMREFKTKTTSKV